MAKIFDNNTLNTAPMDPFNHALKVRPVAVGAGITVIHKFMYLPSVKFRMIADVLENQRPLITDALALVFDFAGFLVSQRQANIIGKLINHAAPPFVVVPTRPDTPAAFSAVRHVQG